MFIPGHLAEWAIERSIRFIYASSAATYGDGTKGFSDDHGKIKRTQADQHVWLFQAGV